MLFAGGEKRCPYTNETDLPFTKISLGLVNVKQISRKTNFKDLSVISCPLKALDRFP